MKLLLVALDASQRASKVLDTAVELAKQTGAKVRLVRAVGVPPEIPMSPFGVSPDGFLEMLLGEGKKQIEALGATVPPELLDGVETRVGAPWVAVCDAAKACNADLIVIGSHGYGGIDRLLGTTAAKVVNHAECSVLVARNLHL